MAAMKTFGLTVEPCSSCLDVVGTSGLWGSGVLGLWASAIL